MIIVQMFDLFLFMIKKMTKGDFVLTFSYFVFLALFIKGYKVLIHVN